MTQDSPILYCYVHPNRETSLRCNNCDRPICVSCAVRTPTGYRCRECVKGQLKVFDTSEWYDYISGFVVAALLSAVAAFLVSLVGGIGGFLGWILIAIGAPTGGVIIAEGVRTVTQRRRSRALFITVAVAVVLGAVPIILVEVFLNPLDILFQVIYLVIVVPVVYSRLSGIQLFR